LNEGYVGSEDDIGGYQVKKQLSRINKMKSLDAIILAGGRGTRLSSVVADRPKVLAEVNGHPFLDIILDTLGKCTLIHRVVLAVGHMAEQITGLYNDENKKYPFEIRFSIEERPLGTGGATRKALSLTTTGSVLVLNGDSFTETKLEELAEFHWRVGAALTMVITEVDNVSRYGRVILDNTGRVVGYEEKNEDGGKGYINAGVYLFERIIFDEIALNKPTSLEKDLLPKLMGKGVYTFMGEGFFIDIGTPESYAAANSQFEKMLKG